jgi:predicted amidohydrolase
MHWQTLLRARAIENVSYVIGVSQCELRHTGGSMAIDPMGVVMTSLADEPAMGFADLTSAHLQACRDRSPSLQNRRYGVHKI